MIKVFVLMIFLTHGVYASCFYVPCTPTVMSQKAQVSAEIKSESQKLNQQITQLEARYKEYKNSIEEGNRLKQTELENKIKLGVLLKQLQYEVEKFTQLQ